MEKKVDLGLDCNANNYVSTSGTLGGEMSPFTQRVHFRVAHFVVRSQRNRFTEMICGATASGWSKIHKRTHNKTGDSTFEAKVYHSNYIVVVSAVSDV